jgi:transcriptional regulator with XRE-family HTH domain
MDELKYSAKLRKYLGLTQFQLAHEAKVPRSVIADIECKRYALSGELNERLLQAIRFKATVQACFLEKLLSKLPH